MKCFMGQTITTPKLKISSPLSTTKTGTVSRSASFPLRSLFLDITSSATPAELCFDDGNTVWLQRKQRCICSECKESSTGTWNSISSPFILPLS